MEVVADTIPESADSDMSSSFRTFTSPELGRE